MNFNFLSPVSDVVLAHNELLSMQALGRKLKVHSAQNGIPDLEGVSVALIGVLENRNDINYIGEEFQLNEIRKSFYALDRKSTRLNSSHGYISYAVFCLKKKNKKKK